MRYLTLLLAGALLLGACSRPSDPQAEARHQAQVDSLMQQLSVREKVNTAVYRAGSDMILMPGDVKLSIDAIADSVETGAWPLAELDAKVRKVLELKARAGFFDAGFDPQVRELDRKIAEARHRDSLLQVRIDRALKRSSKPYIEPVGGDRTLVLDKGGALAPK